MARTLLVAVQASIRTRTTLRYKASLSDTTTVLVDVCKDGDLNFLYRNKIVKKLSIKFLFFSRINVCLMINSREFYCLYSPRVYEKHNMKNI